ncbi:MAG: peptidase S41, partial [Gammaproteobacteria bacterium]
MKKPLYIFCLASICSFSLSPVWGKSQADLPVDEIRDFVDVYNTIRHEYVEEKDGKTLIDYAIKGMLNGLDPHSVYLKKSELSDLKDNTDGSYQGFGIQLEISDGKLIIITPIPGSPAEEAGLKPNDRIMKIDDTVIENISMSEVDRLLKDLDTVTLTIERQGEDTQQVELTKTTVNLPSVSEKVLEKDYGYIRVLQFQLDTSNQFDNALEGLINKNIKGLVLDLRNNPGGLIASATAIADTFLPAGLIVSTKNQNTGSEDKIH